MTDTIRHYGVKGMRWGVRKDRRDKVSRSKKETITRQDIGGKNKEVSLRKAARLDRKFEKKALSNKNFIAVWNQAAIQMNKDYLPKLNAKYEKYDFSNEDWDNPSPIYKKYLKEYIDKSNASLNEASSSIIGTNATGTAHVEFTMNYNGGFPDMRLVYSDVKHDSENTRPIIIKLTWDKGKIVGLRLISDSDSNDDFLSHYGVKGMRWGVRNDRTNRGTKDRNKSESNSNTQTQKPKITGQSARSRMKPLDQMTDEELIKLVSRMENEIRYNANASKLYYSKKEKRAIDTRKFLRDQGKNSAVMVKDRALREGIDLIFNEGKKRVM